MEKSVLITGGAGFIGVNLVDLLLEHGYRVSVLDNFSVCGRETLDGRDVRIVEGDVRDPEKAAEAVEGCDMVVHLAAHTNVINSLKDPMMDAEINIFGTINMLNALRGRKEGTARFVLASSGAPLGDQPPPANENVVPRPLSPYGASKMAGEGYCSAFHGAYGIETTALRFSNCYGPLSAHKTSVVAKFITEILDGHDITIFGDGSQTRDFIYVKDLCNAVRLSLETPAAAGRIYQVATGREVPVGELAEKILQASGSNVKILYEGFRRGEIKRNYSDISRARAELNFEPRYSLDEGLRLTFEWFKSLR